MDKFPKEIPIAYYQPGAKLAQVVVKIKDVVGSVADVNRVTASLNVDIRQSLSYSVPNENFAMYSAFVQFKDKKVSPEQLTKSLKRSKFVFDAEVVEGSDSLLVDTLEFPVNWAGRRIVLLDQLSMGRMLEKIEAMFGSGGALILYEQGFAYGKGFMATAIDLIGREHIVQTYEYGLEVLAATGWGRPRVLSSRGFRDFLVGLERCSECEGRTADKPTSNFVRGFIAALFAALTQKDVDCTEVECVAKGDAQCKFEIHVKD